VSMLIKRLQHGLLQHADRRCLSLVTGISENQQLRQRTNQEPVFNEFRSEALVLMMRIFPLAMMLSE
jgi:hypothetical protein